MDKMKPRVKNKPDYKSKDSQSNSKRNSIVKQKERVAHETKSENETRLQKKKGRRSKLINYWNRDWKRNPFAKAKIKLETNRQ